MPPKDQLTPEALGAFQKSEIAKWWPMLKAANVKWSSSPQCCPACGAGMR